MTMYKNKYRIEPNRWQLWDYSAPGAYFLTICINHRDEILGSVNRGKMQLSENGKIVAKKFLEVPSYNNRIILDEWVIMPNHVHCIIVLGQYDFDNGFKNNLDVPVVEKIREFSLHKPNEKPSIEEIKQYRKMRRRMLIPLIMGKFKMQTSKQINIIEDAPSRKIWQRDYYDHVIRNEKEYRVVKNYIINNPQNWKEDKFNENEQY